MTGVLAVCTLAAFIGRFISLLSLLFLSSYCSFLSSGLLSVVVVVVCRDSEAIKSAHMQHHYQDHADAGGCT